MTCKYEQTFITVFRKQKTKLISGVSVLFDFVGFKMSALKGQFDLDLGRITDSVEFLLQYESLLERFSLSSCFGKNEKWKMKNENENEKWKMKGNVAMRDTGSNKILIDNEHLHFSIFWLNI